MQVEVLSAAVAALVDRLDADAREAFEERAGIAEFDGGLPRPMAEALALLEVLRCRPEALLGVRVGSVGCDGRREWVLRASRPPAAEQRTTPDGPDVTLHPIQERSEVENSRSMMK